MQLFLAATTILVLAVWADTQLPRHTAGFWQMPPVLEITR